MRRLGYFSISTVILLLMLSSFSQARQVQALRPCKGGLYGQPGGRFALIISCEDALGAYATLVHLGAMGAPRVGAWDISQRTFEGVWAKDITSFTWSTDGKRLYTATSEVYGDGGIYEIELASKKVRKVFPAGRATGETIYTLRSFDSKSGEIVFSIQNPERREERSLKISK